MQLNREILEEEKEVKRGLFGKGTEKPPSIIICDVSAYVKGRVVFSAKSAENLHPKPLTTLLYFQTKCYHVFLPTVIATSCATVALALGIYEKRKKPYST